MPLFDKKDDVRPQETSQAEQAASDDDYFAGMAGEGLDEFTPDTLSTAYLSMVQPGSTAAATHTPGTWRNSAMDENYGPAVEVVVLAFKTVWTERSKDPPYFTVGRYMPKSIEVQTTYPKAGTRGFPKMKNPLSDNEVQELFVYACMIKDKPEQGILYFSPTISSMTTCKQWNTQLRSQRVNTPDGKSVPAAIHQFSWILELDLVQNPARPQNPNEKITKFVRVQRGECLARAYHEPNVKPHLIAAQNVVLLAAAPETSGESEVA